MANKFGLGRGLADLASARGAIPDISLLTPSERVVVRQIPLVQIGANPDQPRKTFTESELSDLAASIKEKGVLQPILLRNVSGRAHMYEIVAGERRFRAAKMAGLNEIPALVKNLDDNNTMEIALIENVQRENLNPIEEAQAYDQIIKKLDYTQDELAKRISISPSAIGMYERDLREPNDEITLKLADFFKVSTDYLLGKTDIRNVGISISRIPILRYSKSRI